MTSFFFARLVTSDQWHERAKRAAKPGWLQAKGFFSPALSFLRGIRHSPEMGIVYPDAALQSDAWELFGKWGRSGANAVDCASFAVMRSLGIKKAFTFDKRFHQAGFEIL